MRTQESTEEPLPPSGCHSLRRILGDRAETARRLGSDGYRVAVVGSRPADRVAELLGLLRDGLYVQADLTSAGAASDVVKAVLDAWGRVDTVVYARGPRHQHRGQAAAGSLASGPRAGRRCEISAGRGRTP
ncbi:SDR family NAD(P)-dependent oxidoreductase [Streptomyces yerevanensis]|uniref:SDR family NAD(P)-dependent oxidoreductase n=1 Tax=Streptomyces yerevanensis TaxID=66378 RepID=UPI0012FEEA6E|nr:SDR family NAD(P)-dependent oxidoreductase [Streptomyces yerevanensis]